MATILTGVLGGQAAWAAPGPMDFLFQPGAQAPRQQRAWRLGEYGGISLLAREAGSAPNQQPSDIAPATLKAFLSDLSFDSGAGRLRPLFERDELDGLADALARALARSGPDDDVALMSSARREAGPLSMPRTVTARLFVHEGWLNCIVQDARADIPGLFRSSGVTPSIDFGQRQQASAVQLRSSIGVLRRPDWAAFALATPVAPASVPNAGAPAPAATGHAPGPGRATSFYQEQADRLQGLRLLREQNLITEEEYQRKRQAIVDAI